MNGGWSIEFVVTIVVLIVLRRQLHPNYSKGAAPHASERLIVADKFRLILSLMKMCVRDVLNLSGQAKSFGHECYIS